jgi:hypothetical protein
MAHRSSGRGSRRAGPVRCDGCHSCAFPPDLQTAVREGRRRQAEAVQPGGMFPAPRRTVNLKMPLRVDNRRPAALVDGPRQVRSAMAGALAQPPAAAALLCLRRTGGNAGGGSVRDLPRRICRFARVPALEVVGLGAQYLLPAVRVRRARRRLHPGAEVSHGDWRHGRVLGALLAATRAASGVALPQAVLAVPLHATRYRERGFNQAELIAQSAARWLSLPLDRPRAAGAHAPRSRRPRSMPRSGAATCAAHSKLHERVWRDVARCRGTSRSSMTS